MGALSLKLARSRACALAQVKRWDNHKLMVRWLSRFFNYLDRYYITRHSLNALKDVGMLAFKEHVYTHMKGSIKDAVLVLIDKARSRFSFSNFSQ